MVINTKAFGAALVAGLLAFTTVVSVPATAYAASNNTHANYGNSQKHATTTTPESTQAPLSFTGSTSTTNDETPAEQKDNTPANNDQEVAPSVTGASTKTSDPAGNNGTVKIDRAPFDSNPNNEPHVTCTFQVDFYGYDKGVGNAQVEFALQPPTKDGRTLTVTSGNLTPNIGEDAAGGGTDVDAQETYTLKFTGAPHEKQGYHVKLTVHAPGSQGSDVKHKVFWVQPCNDENGHVLSETTPSTTEGGKGGVMPETMPSTGANVVFATIATALASILTYVLAYRYDLRKLI